MNKELGFCFSILLALVLMSGCINNSENGHDNELEEVWKTVTDTGYVEEGDIVDVINLEINSTDYLTNLTVTVSWTDEPDNNDNLRTYENWPDLFQVWITDNEGITQTGEGSNQEGEEGQVVVEFPFHYFDKPRIQGPINITISVEIIEAGDYYPDPGLSLSVIEDTGNDFTCTVDYSTLTLIEK